MWSVLQRGGVLLNGEISWPLLCLPPRQNELISSAAGWNRFNSGTTRWWSFWMYEPVSGRRFELIWLLGSIKPDGCLSVQIVFSASGAASRSGFSLRETSLDVFIVFLWRCSEFQLSWKIKKSERTPSRLRSEEIWLDSPWKWTEAFLGETKA